MIENVPGLLSPRFAEYRKWLEGEFLYRGYPMQMTLLNAADFGVPQNRMRVVIVGLRREYMQHFKWPKLQKFETPTVGNALFD